MSATLAMHESGSQTRRWTDQQRLAIERREGDLLLAAGAGSGKTSVLVERFVRSVVEDGVGVGEILTITFTEKAAAEMRDRIRARFRERGEAQAAVATEGAFIATIHGFCARVLRAHALRAGIDPGFAVLDQHEARTLADAAFEQTLQELAAADGELVELIAAHGVGGLRAGILATYAELRSRGLPAALPALPAPTGVDEPALLELEPAVRELRAAAQAAAAELATVDKPGVRVLEALDRLARSEAVAGAPEPWPGDLDALALPRGNGAALSTPVCQAYTEALARLRQACEHRCAGQTRELLHRLLGTFAERYEQRKRERSALDFEDLELLTRELLRSDADLRTRYRERFKRIMVDELQDTNAVQLELIGALATANLFTVGDAQQSIYGFRHADVELFERLAAERLEAGAFATLQVNFRSRREILDVINAAFSAACQGFIPLEAGRDDPPAADPRVELLVIDKGADYQLEGQAAPWRVAEARALAARVAQLVRDGAAARDIVVLTRATTDLRTYERALEERGVPTYLIGGRGYWGHPQVLDLVAYLRALANPLDEEALYTVLASPLVGVSLDALVLVAGAASASGRDPWSVLGQAGGRVDGGAAPDVERLERFVAWFAGERELMAGAGIEALIDRALAASGYDLEILSLSGGRRRLANLRKLMRLAREYEAQHGPDLRGFLGLVAERAGASGADARESEAPVEGEALDAVRLMTIHRAKGLEFDLVCVADLGRVRRTSADLIRLGTDGRLGLRLARPGSGKALGALAYQALGEERQAFEQAEERRLFYVAMTRAKERLLVSGAAKLDGWPEGNGGTAIGWVAPALIPDFAERLGEGSGVTEQGLAFTVMREAGPGPPAGRAALAGPAPIVGRTAHPDDSGPAASPAPGAPADDPRPAASPTPPATLAGASPAPAVTTLSYTSLAQYRRCGYRFYVERVLGVPPVVPAARPAPPAPPVPPATPPDAPPPQPPARRSASLGLSASERGVLVHALLEPLDFRRPRVPDADAVARAAARLGLPRPGAREAGELAELVRGLVASELGARLGRATQVRREQRFSFPLAGELLVTGALDVVARERTGMLVVDYKSDRLATATPAEVAHAEYGDQRLIYALAVLRSGAVRVEVAHVFLDRPGEPVRAHFTAADVPALRAQLQTLASGLLRGEFEVSPVPHRAICDGCPAQGGLCSWPLAMTARERPDQLF